MMKERYKKENRGITLVALVVTIVVLLILSGITITALFGDNGIIKQAQKAQNLTKQDQINTQQGLQNLANQLSQALGEPITKKEHTAVNLTDGTSENGKGYTWSQLYDVSKAISKTTVADDVREITVNLNGKNYTVGIGDEATVYYDGTTGKEEKTVRLIGFNHDTVAERESYGASKAGMTFEFVDFLGTHNMNGTNSSTSTNAGGWAASEMREYLNGYRTLPTPTPTPTASPLAPEYKKIKETSEETAETLKIQKVIKEYIPEYDKANTAKSEDYLWLLSCAEIWNDGYTTETAGYAKTKEGSQYAFYKYISDLKCNVENDAIKKTSTSSSNSWWLRSPHYGNSIRFCAVYSNGLGSAAESYITYGVAPGFSI